MSWNIAELNVIRWSEARGIIPNSTSLAQHKKAQEEMNELLTAITDRDRAGIIDGVGDILVCLINVCALEDVSMTQCRGCTKNMGIIWAGKTQNDINNAKEKK